MITKPGTPTSRISKKKGGSQDAANSFLSTPRDAARPRLRVSHGSAQEPPHGERRPVPSPHVLNSTEAAALAPPPRPRRSAKTSADTSSNAVQLAVAIAAAALEKKALNIEIIDLAGKADYADYLVLMTGTSDRHVRALADTIEDSLRQKKVRPISVEGLQGGSWVLIDYGDVVTHVFQQDTRELYDIDGLWLDAARVPLPQDAAAPSRPAAASATPPSKSNA